MKKISILIFVMILFVLKSYADDLGLGDFTQGVDNAWYGQKSITDEDFEKTMKKIEDKKKKNKNKKLKGKSLKDEEHSESINSPSDRYNLLGLPVTTFTIDGIELPIGHYKVVGLKEKDKIYFDFYQAHSKIARLEGKETESDFDEPAVNFIKLVPIDTTRLKLIYGSIEFNGFAYLYIKDAISDLN